jgi:PAS domain S-box-containing protein
MQTSHGPVDSPAPRRSGQSVDLEAFRRVVRGSQERAREIVGQLGADWPADDDRSPLATTTHEWLAAVEELEVAEEELRQQSDELAATAAEVRSQEARYQELFDFAPDAYVVSDAQGVVREANRAAAALFHIPRAYLSGKPLAVFIDPEARRVFRDCVGSLRTADRAERSDIRLRPRYGPAVYVSLAATASRDVQGNVTAIRWILRDVSEQRRAIDHLRAINVAVERRVADRMERLERIIRERDARIDALEAQLAAERQARADAEALAAERAAFLGMLSHEIRTPLHASQGYLELLELAAGEALTPEQEGYLARMHRVQEYLLSVLEGVLALSRLERGAADLALANVLVDEVLSTILNLVQPQVLERGIRYEHESGDPSATVYADREKLQQIILNLVSNAVKFTPPGGRVAVSWETSDRCVAIHVRDTGDGIRAEDVDRIFEPFVQAATPVGTSRGVGLGLAISRQFARLMGGDITVVSTVGEGAAFTLTLPCGPASAEAADGSHAGA